jgi:hypothetical protein
MTVRRRFSEYLLDADVARPFLHDIMPVGGSDVPVEVRAWREASGRIRRVRAAYPNGWTLQFTISTRGVIGRVRATTRLSIQARGFTA